MVKHKNKLKDRVNYCFLCGRFLSSIKEKIIHRINTNKENKVYNVLIVCPDCKQHITKNGIHYTDIHTEYLLKYFKNFTKECQHIVMDKVFFFFLRKE